MNLQVWNGGVGSGTVVATIPLPNPIHQYRPPKHRITVPGPVYDVTIFTAPPPSGTRDYGNVIVIDNVVYTPPDPDPTFTFDLPPTSDQKVLIHKYGSDNYPSPLQTDDRKIRVEGTVTLNGQPAAGKTIYFRLKDPQDSTAYVQNAGDAHQGDNVDGPGSVNGGATATAISDGAGRVSVTLEVTDHVAGDNYQIDASTKAAFLCVPACPKSAVYTAWKRVYVEVNKMFRRGAFLTASVAPGTKVLPVSDVRGFPSTPFQIRLIHGPKPWSGLSTFHSEEVTVVDVKGRRLLSMSKPEPGELHLDPDPAIPGIQNAYHGPQVLGLQRKERRQAAADAVGLITGNRADDYYLLDGRLANAAFDKIFVELVWLTDASPADGDLLPAQPRVYHDGVVPYVDVLNLTDQWDREWLTIKWAHNVTHTGGLPIAKPNHQILFTSSRRRDNPQNTTYAETSVDSGYNDLWLYLDKIPGGIEPEALVHELAHEWKVNPGAKTGGHCDIALGKDMMMALHGSKKCTMTSYMYSEAAASDGVVGFHYFKPAGGGAVHSEYLRIRQRDEPIPQNEFQLRSLK